MSGQFKFDNQSVKMANRKPICNENSLSAKEWEQRKENTNRIFSEMLQMSKKYGDEIRDRNAIDVSEQFRAKIIADDRQRRMDARIDARLAPNSSENARSMDWRNMDREKVIQREIYRTTSRMNAIEGEAVKAMEEERSRSFVNWRGRADSSATSSAISSASSKCGKQCPKYNK